MTTVFVPFKKSFVGKSLNGQVFYWLRCVYGEALGEAVDNAVRLIYSPSALAASSTTWNEVKAEVAYCRAVFEEMMDLASCAPPSKLPIPCRINVQFGASINSSAHARKAYEWLFATYENRAIAIIVHAVHLVYLPAALAASAEFSKDASLQVGRSRIFFEQEMRNAIRESSPNDSELIAHRLEQVFHASPSDESLDGVPPPAPTDSHERNEEQEDIANDFVPVDPDIDF
jgi:hypothetical protein